MTELPNLNARTLERYNRLAREVAAFNYVLLRKKPSGHFGMSTLFALNGLFILANRLFRRHPDLPHFFHVDIGTPMTHADLCIMVARLTTACEGFEARYSHQTQERKEAAKRLARMNALEER